MATFPRKEMYVVLWLKNCLKQSVSLFQIKEVTHLTFKQGMSSSH